MLTARQETRAIGRLAMPMMVSHLGWMMLWVVDVMMLGHVGHEALGSVSLARLWIMATMTVAMGIVMGIDPLISQAHGADDPEVIGETVQRGLTLALMLSLPVAGLYAITEGALVALGQDAGLAANAGMYTRIQIPAVPLTLIYIVFRQYLIDRGITAPVMWVTWLANIVNAIANYALIFGKFGLPRLEVRGASIATLMVQSFMTLVLLLWIVRAKHYEGGWTGFKLSAWSPFGTLKILRFGIPIGFQYGLEMGAFATANLLAGWLGKIELAAHAIAINLASITFMLPFGISFGAVTRVGNLIGKGQPQAAQRSAYLSLWLGGGIMTAMAGVFLLGRNVLPRIYSEELQVIATAATLLPIAAAFQLFDGVQAVGAGILRGMGRTRPAAVFNLVGYYGLAVPLAWLLAFKLGWGLPGIWWGMALGLAMVAVCLVLWIRVKGPAHVDAKVV